MTRPISGNFRISQNSRAFGGRQGVSSAGWLLLASHPAGRSDFSETQVFTLRTLRSPQILRAGLLRGLAASSNELSSALSSASDCVRISCGTLEAHIKNNSRLRQDLAPLISQDLSG